MEAGHECGAACWEPVRCIVCRRIKAPAGQTPAPELAGMRCLPVDCAGYHLDPRPGHLWPVVERRAAAVSVPDVPDVRDALGRALCDHYFAAAVPPV